MAFAVDITSTSPFARHFFKAYDVPSEINKKAKWITLSPSPLPSTIAQAVLPTSFKAAREQDRPFEWMLASNMCTDRRLNVFGEQIILSSLRYPSLNISFTINRWACFVTLLQYINEAACLRPLKGKTFGRRRVSFRKHLGDRIYFTVLCRKHIIEFRKQHCVMYGESIRSVLSSRSGISIRTEDEWIDLQQNVIPDIQRHYPMFAAAQPQCGCLPYGVAKNNYLGWKACTVCFPFGCDSDNEDSDCDGDYTFDAGPISKLSLAHVFNSIVGLS